jgi:three-Cys-motif partner protein
MRKSVPKQYEGREQAFIKHELLQAYLEKLFLIIGMSSSKIGVREICYVDCFAGPWSAGSENLTDTSIGVSLRILDKCRKELAKRSKDLRFRALYVEKDPEAFQQLDGFVRSKTPVGIDARAIHGDFVRLRDEILRWCGTDSFAFFFIDPTGWKDVAVEILDPLLQRAKSEFLINFMYDFVNRTASMADWKSEIALLLGETVDVTQMHGKPREKVLVDTYRRNLKGAMPSTGRWSARSAHVRVLDREKERPKYHLVYLTMHPRGITEFMEISENLGQVQRRVRASTKQAARIRKSGQNELFNESDFVDPSVTDTDITEVERYWLAYLSAGERRIGPEEFADILEETDWLPGDLQRGLSQLMANGRVVNMDAKAKRPKNPLHWENRERLRLGGK